MAPRQKRSRAVPAAAREDIRDRYGAPFPIYSEDEGELFDGFRRSAFNKHKIIDWEMVSTLGIEFDLHNYLSKLHCLDFARMPLLAYRDICLEMLCTFNLFPEGRRATCRLGGREVTLTPDLMHTVFGFSADEGAHLSVPSNFVASEAWFALTGFQNWTNTGSSNGLLRDPALLVLHKFLSASVMGKHEPSKVNESECYLLWAATRDNEPVSLTGFIFRQINNLCRNSRIRPAFATIATKLAIHLNYLDPGMAAREIPFSSLSYAELHKGHYLTDDQRRFLPHMSRPCVITVLARERYTPPGSSGGAGPSSQAAAEEPAYTYNPTAGPAAFEARFDAFQTSLFERLDTMQAAQESSHAALAAQMADLQRQWQQWSGLYPPPRDHSQSDPSHPPF